MPKRNFEIFMGRCRPTKSTDPRISIGKRRNFYLNAAAYSLLGSSPAVVLMFDKETRAIGLRPAGISTKHAHAIRKQAGAESYVIGAIAFMRTYGLLSDNKTLAFIPRMEDGVVVLELDNATVLAPRKQNRTGESQ